MELVPQIADNMTELLAKILEFTKQRRQVLLSNINNADLAGFVPCDLNVNEFSDLLNFAIDEHIANNRIVLQDTDDFQFGSNGCFQISPIIDQKAKKLRISDKNAYLDMQINKLLENSLNQKIALQMLKKKKTLESFSQETTI